MVPDTLRAPVVDVIEILPLVLVKVVIGTNGPSVEMTMSVPASKSMPRLKIPADVICITPAARSFAIIFATGPMVTIPPLDVRLTPAVVDTSESPTETPVFPSMIIDPFAVSGATRLATLPLDEVMEIPAPIDVIAF